MFEVYSVYNDFNFWSEGPIIFLVSQSGEGFESGFGWLSQIKTTGLKNITKVLKLKNDLLYKCIVVTA